ncbi:hypothetical protein [Granulicella mallensis]|uniref:Uncharacterized protein n=1 Tax=Granulicella mallensis TaxID=940614 RepID=A0A7W7ZQ64_9BACT|nr:hypothetical protein [Granulicella mallensis]MBB5063236.1 hypothetical protein [Granulicella mallensis]
MSGQEAFERRRRLSASPSMLLPWVRAEQSQNFFLYWLPVSGFPVVHNERVWLQDFYLRLAAQIENKADLRSEVFVQLKMFTNRRSEVLQRYREKYPVMLGLSRAPDAPTPPMPTAEDAKRLALDGKEIRIEDSVADYCYWLEGGTFPTHVETFLGNGGFLTLFLLPDPKPKPAPLPLTPKLRAALPGPPGMDLDAMLQSAARKQESFLAQSKRLFGRGLEEQPEYIGLQYIVPLLKTSDFLNASPELLEDWFSFFGLYLNESPADGGVIMSFQRDLEPLLVEVLTTMREEGKQYPASRKGFQI